MKVADGGWTILYGDLINEWDVVTGLASIPIGAAGVWASEQIQAQLQKFQQSLSDVSDDSLDEQDFDGLGVNPGIITYKRWLEFPFGLKTDLPDNYQPVYASPSLYLQKVWDGVRWENWETLGGKSLSSVTAVSRGRGRIDLFGIGVSNACYHKWWEGTWGPSETEWQELGGVFTSPIHAVSWGPNRLDLFGRGQDNICLHKWWDGARDGWFGWELLHGVLLGGPPTAVSLNGLDVFATGTDNACYHGWWDGSEWKAWESLGNI
ncbi:hypothetical protein ANOM_011489 [Aspergillus nomiae NRRL 13137]|uniref:PLL-like beta propeller domain-containing protein n=1 Tax=Aspergillus nomiae NRRL (strain ATCC 15546 / NRRL 13137 / CBS 260.88 / M93) TaxID=1509407 RepID=A0A0L1IL70_ASPN3|nr:uncharacterized protein ANOM_011489 [Aspergillus nomiae NRRL 13137]KNG80329.1 hypothetical protein ANOM_011489 [Aspergillus nomiae NRRL 13137]